MHSPRTSLRMWAILLAAGCALGASVAHAKEFTFDAKTNAQMAKTLNIPVFFAFPDSARAELPGNIEIADRLIDFKHPEAANAQGNVGLRLIVGKRQGIAKRLAESGLVKTGDILLSFRNEWGGAGPYPNIQMGVSHTGVAYIKNGVVHNIDNPMSGEYLGQLNASHYRELKYVHIIRPRNLSDDDRENLAKWAARLADNAKRVYPKQISFNSDYNAPKYQPGKRLEFVKQLGQIALGQNPQGNVSMYCSEFAWSLLALKGCNPDTSDKAFKRERVVLKRWNVPSCVKPAMAPMHATDDFVYKKGHRDYSGLAEGPLLVIDSMKLPEADRAKKVHSVFVSRPGGLARMSSGHRQVAQQMQPKFAPLEMYYMGVGTQNGPTKEAKAISSKFNQEVPDNYSPTSFIINTLLPRDNSNRAMDYVATIVFE